MKKILLQKSHINIKTNSIVALRGSTGAPNEAQFNEDIANRLKLRLEETGKFQVVIDDGNANDHSTTINTDWDLFLSIHYDADIYRTGGGFVDFPEPSTDGATKESQRIAKNIEEQYFETTGIKNVPSRSNANTRYYYMWKYLTAKTPCVLIECGVGMHKPDDYNILHNNRDLVVEGLYKGIMKSFNYKPQPKDWKSYFNFDVTKRLSEEILEGLRLKEAVNFPLNTALDSFKDIWNVRHSQHKKELENRKEQVERLEDSILREQELRNDLIKALADKETAITKMAEAYEFKVGELNEIINEVSKEKGRLILEKNKLATELELCKNKECVEELTVAEVLLLIFEKLKGVKLK
jgi:hypothetical protein